MISPWIFHLLVKPPVVLAAIVLASVLVPLSCKDSGDIAAPSPGQLIQVTLKSSDIYQYPTGASGDEEGAVITKQASHFRISEIRRDASTNFNCIYFYQPQAGFTGQDSADLELHTNKVGTPDADHVSTIGFRFTVTP